MINREFPVRYLIATEGELRAIARGIAPEVYAFVYHSSEVPLDHQQDARELLVDRYKYTEVDLGEVL